MTSFKHILFDLDGTIIDPKKSVIEAVQYALSKFGIVVSDPEKLTCFIGPPLSESFRDYYDLGKANTKIALNFYREHYTNHGMSDHKMYYGMRELLETLKKRDKRLYIATSKPEEFAVKILEDLELDHYFDIISACDIKTTGCEKPTIIAKVLKEINEEELNMCVMIGDTKYDVRGARSCGIKSIGVMHGYGDIQEMIMSGVDYFVSDAEELSFLLK
jgi:phosphoglycolate phosphatase